LSGETVQITDLRDGEREISLNAGLDRANQIEMLRQISLRKQERFRVPSTLSSMCPAVSRGLLLRRDN
jgi:hypothetical protein